MYRIELCLAPRKEPVNKEVKSPPPPCGPLAFREALQGDARKEAAKVGSQLQSCPLVPPARVRLNQESSAVAFLLWSIL